MAYTLRSAADGRYLDDKFVKWDEVGLIGPSQSASKLWTFGDNTWGQLGLGDIVHRSSPIQVGSLSTWSTVSNGGTSSYPSTHNTAVRADGTLWVWGGNNTFYSLGLTDVNHRSSPVQVGSLTNWKSAVSGNLHNFAIKTDGSLWAWGYNSTGALGDGTSTNRSSPVQVGTSTDWKQVTTITAFGHSVGIKNDGTLWTWGSGEYGILGLGNTTNVSVPTQVGTLNNWGSLSSNDGSNNYGVYVVKTDGSLWAWGGNSYGNLGLGDRTHRSSPTQVGALTNWKQVSCTGSGVLAIKTDGTLWSWGLTQIVGYVSSPVQIGALTNWKSVSAGDDHAFAFKTDGTLWAWGSNTYGQLGLGDTTYRSSPVQVGTLTNWKSVDCGFRCTTLMQYNY